jgi:hypothetical protein
MFSRSKEVKIDWFLRHIVLLMQSLTIAYCDEMQNVDTMDNLFIYLFFLFIYVFIYSFLSFLRRF